jgi:hypothetical protein
MMRWIPGTVSLFAVAIGGATPGVGQEGIPVRGHLVMADGVVVLEPCGTFEPYALSTSSEVGGELANAVEVYGGPTRRRIFVDMAGWMDTGPLTRAASTFAGTWIPTRVESVRGETATDCRNETPPLWLRPGCERLSAPDLDCLPADLVAADLGLARYVTEALEFGTDAGEIAAAHAAWKRTRELRCTDTRLAGRVDPLWVMSCRLATSRARLLAIWDEHLSGTATDLPDPRSTVRFYD